MAYMSGLMFLVIALMCTFAPDLTWEIQHVRNSMSDHVSERTKAFGTSRKFTAVIFFPLSVLMFYIAFTS